MTKYKEYLRTKGVMLNSDISAIRSACDFEDSACAGIEWDVSTAAMDNCIVAITYSNIAEPEYAVYNRYGECNYYNSRGYQTYVGDPHCDPELMAWLYDNGFTDRALNHLMIHYSPLYSSYGVYVAFLHVRAGIMDEATFYKLVSKRCQQTINFYHIDTVLN